MKKKDDAAKQEAKKKKQQAKAQKQEAKKKKKQAKQEAKAKKKEAKAQKNEGKNKDKQEKQAAKAQKKKEQQAAKAKKQESKKAAAAKKKADKQAKAAKKDGGEGEQTRRRLNLKVVIPLALVLLAGIAAGVYFFLLRGGAEEIQPPTAYAISEESTIVLDGFLEEGGKISAITLQLPESEDGEKEDKKDDKKEEDSEEDTEPQLLPIDTVAIYDYVGVTPNALEQYLDALLAEDEGFVLVDEGYKKLETRPVFGELVAAEDDDAEAETMQLVDGTALLARETSSPDAEGRLFQLRLTWTADGNTCSVEVSCPEAAFPAESIVNSSGALSFIKSQRPSDLGLPGESMDEYNIYNQDGVLVIDGRVYRKFIIYEPDEVTGTNSYVGEYLLSGDGRSVFKRDSLTGELQRVK